MKSSLLDVFAGPPYTGTYSPCVQVCTCHCTLVVTLHDEGSLPNIQISDVWPLTFDL